MSENEKKPEGTKTLLDDEIVSERADAKDMSRRSMIGAIGAVAAGGAAATVLPGCYVRRPGVVYAAQPAGAVYVQGPQVQARYSTGVTDSDGGPYADPAGQGRGQRRQVYTGLTDSDGGAYADPGGYGRGVYGRASGLTDSDAGAYADPAGNGRGTARHGHTGITDSDGGPYADPAGSGRGRWR